MQQRSIKLCRACRAPLGKIERGDLRPAPGVRASLLHGDGTATLPCAACGAENLWLPRRRDHAGQAAEPGRAAP